MKHCKYSDPMWPAIPIPFKSRHFQQPIFVTLLPSPFISTASRAQAMHFRKRTAYDVFLTHHKAAAALSARLARVGGDTSISILTEKLRLDVPYLTFLFKMLFMGSIGQYTYNTTEGICYIFGEPLLHEQNICLKNLEGLWQKKDGGQLWFIAPAFARLCCCMFLRISLSCLCRSLLSIMSNL